MKRSPSPAPENSTYPSPDEICCAEMAPASGQPLQPPVFTRLLPLIATFESLVQFTPIGPDACGAGAGAGEPESELVEPESELEPEPDPFPIMTFHTVELSSNSVVSTMAG